MPKITLDGHIVVSDSDLAAVQAELPKHIELTQKEQGCLIFRISQNLKNKHVFNVYEEFINRDAFEKHQQRVKSSRWGKITKNIERHYKIIEGKYEYHGCKS